MTNLFDLTSRTAVVTGSAQGMGRAMALARPRPAPTSCGWTEWTASSRPQGAAERPRPTDTDHIDRVFATVDREFGRVDCWPRSWSGKRGEAVNSCQKKQV